MCFSQTASFSAGVILTLVGVATLKKVQAPSQLMFALFPIFFAIQQFTEGFVWVTLTNTSYQPWQSIPIYTFVFFAQVFWPVWVPLSFYLMEKNSKRKTILGVFVGIGSALALFHFYNILAFYVTASVKPYHIYYDLEFPLRHNLIMELLYLLIIIVPAAISSIQRTHILGFLLFTSFLISDLYFKDYIVSVWCFFAAFISILVYLIMTDLQKNELLENRY